MYTIYVLLVSTGPNCQSILLCDQPFSICRPFWDKCTKWAQNDLEPYKVKCKYMHYQCRRVSNFSPFHSMTIFKLQGMLRQVYQMTSKWTWTLPGQKYTTYVLLVSQVINFSFALWPAIFKISLIYNSPFTAMLNAHPHPPLQEYTRIFGSKSGVYLQRRYRLKIILPYVVQC